MKPITLLLITALLLFTNIHIYAQHATSQKRHDVEGLYLSFPDFKQRKLTLPTDKRHNGDKIKLKQFFISPKVISIEQGVETFFYKDSIFAIHLTNGANYRFINRTPCLIADTSFLYIYAYKTTKNEFSKVGTHSKTKVIQITNYYFSIGNHKEVYLLTLVNLRKYALSNANVHTAVCNKFITDDMLSEINPNTGHFVVNETILLSIHN